MASLQDRAVRIARRMKGVPDDVDDDALPLFGIDPMLITIILSVIAPLLTRCLANNPFEAFNRLLGFRNETKAMAKVKDRARLAVHIRSVMHDNGYPVQVGDVASMRAAVEEEAADVKDVEEVRELMLDAQFMGV